MIKIKRALALMLVLILCCSTSLAAKKKATEYTAREITTEVVQDIPAEIQNMLDIAYEQLIETDGKNLKEKNKYTKWRNDYKFEWCGGFVTWCMLEAGIPMEEKNKIEDGEVEGLFHVKEAGVGKLYEGYAKLNRITRVPQKGYIAVYGNEGSGGSTPFYHVGLVYDVEKLSDGIYRITTIEGNVKGHTVKMYVRDYDLNKASDKKQKPKDMSLVPQEERDREETNIFSYGYAYTKKNMYITIFLMPWIPEESQESTEE
ncbi:CHAP domain-containing protein [Clostridiales bacterium FE2011]|nr:CHAP domain-containing protein [Clostridiales bacterium FE2011]QTE74881.1 CHAP domain-containing protein [Clostridiales bacterium FE2010]